MCARLLAQACALGPFNFFFFFICILKKRIMCRLLVQIFTTRKVGLGCFSLKNPFSPTNFDQKTENKLL
jgi:hypothetical protein